MKQLILMRHAKAQHGSMTDILRPLETSGIKAATFMGNHLRGLKLTPDALYSSTATRAKETAHFFASAAGFTSKIEFFEAFYYGYRSELIDTVRNTDISLQKIMLVGHNPTWSELVHFLSGKLCDMSTASIAILNLKSDTWTTIGQNSCSFEQHLNPSEIM